MKNTRIFAGVFLVLLISLSSCAGITRSMLYYPGSDQRIPHIEGGELIEITSGGNTSRGLFAPGGEDLVVLFHGNGGTFYNQEGPGRRWQEAGFSVLLVEYPGYGISADSRLSEKGIYRDADALLSYIIEERGFTSGQIILSGHSLGSGPAIEMASRGYGRSLILFTPFTSIEDIGARSMPRWVVRILLTDRYDNDAKAENLIHPALIIHGDGDQVVPFELGERLSGIFTDGNLIKLNTTEHGNIYDELSDGQWEKIVGFAKSEGRNP